MQGEGSSLRGPRNLLIAIAIVTTTLLLPRPAAAYIEIPYSMGRVLAEATNIMVVRVTKVDHERNTIEYAKVKDIKGKNATDVIKHNIAQAGFNPREWQGVMKWAEVGKTAVIFHNNQACETCIDGYWYQAYAGGEWWNMSHAEPYLLRTYIGKPEKLAPLIEQMLAGQEVILPCMVDGDKMALQLRTGRVQRLRASLKLFEYNAKRDFVGWGQEDFRPISGMPGFVQIGTLSRTDTPGALPPTGTGGVPGIALVDLDHDGASDFCLWGPSRVVVVQNAGGTLSEIALPIAGGARAAEWCDFDGDGKPDLFVVTPSGPRLFHNEGAPDNGAVSFRDYTAALPKEAYYNCTAGAWIDYDGDGHPDLLLANGFRGLRLYRNITADAAAKADLRPKLGKWYVCGPFDNTGDRGFTTPDAPEREAFALKKEWDGKGGVKAQWKEAQFTDGQNNSLAMFPDNNWASAFVYREIESPTGGEMQVSLGSDDTRVVYFNGQKIHADNGHHAAGPDQAILTLKLKPGKNTFMMKIGQGEGEWAFYFAVKGDVQPAIGPMFVDVSEQVGLGMSGLGLDVKGDAIAVADVNGDGRPDFLYSAGDGQLFLNTPKGFVLAQGSGVHYTTGGVAPLFVDFEGNNVMSLLIPQKAGVKYLQNDGKGHFTDATSRCGHLGKDFGDVRSVALGDFNHSGRQDVMLGVDRGPNRWLRNDGKLHFTDASDSIGLDQRIFNTRAIAVIDVNKDGVPDVLMNNEGQEPAILVGHPQRINH